MRDLRLEPLGTDHLAELDALLHDPLVLRYTRIPDGPAPAAAMLERYDEDDTREAFAALDPDGGFVGVGVVVGLDRTAAEAELGYMVAPAFRGRGAATAVLRLLTERAFAELALERVSLHISADNTASERVAERNGYTREGLMRSLYTKPGVRTDTSLWSKLPSDPVS